MIAGLVAALFGITVVAQDLVSSRPQCQLLSIPVTVSNIHQKNLTGPIDFATYNGSYAAFPDSTISGTYNISASLCGPTTANSARNATLQILVHGASYNKTYWSGLRTPPDSVNGTVYSWIDYAASQGYYTLAIDRLCNGNSSRPDGANVCQAPVEAAAIHQLVQLARNGNLSPTPYKPFTKIIYVGHSLGSELGSYFVNTYPNDANIVILTGFSSFSAPSQQAIGLAVGASPARDVFARYATLQPPYLAFSDPNTVRTTFYFGSFNPSLAALDYQGTGTTTYGELESFALGLAPQPNIKIPLMILNGQEDQIYCPVTAVDAIYGFPGQCGTGANSLTARSRVLFPNIPAFSYYNIPNTGHCLNLHYSAPTAFAAAQQFLTAQNF